MRAEFTCTCVDWPFGILMLERILERAEEITMEEFLGHCEIDSNQIEEFEDDYDGYAFFQYQGWYFFRWKTVNHFYRTQ